MVHTVYAVYHGFLQHNFPDSTGVVMAKISSKVGCEANPSLPLLKQIFSRQTNKHGYVLYIYIYTRLISTYKYTYLEVLGFHFEAQRFCSNTDSVMSHDLILSNQCNICCSHYHDHPEDSCTEDCPLPLL